jgi:hypothetical protein
MKVLGGEELVTIKSVTPPRELGEDILTVLLNRCEFTVLRSDGSTLPGLSGLDFASFDLGKS